MRIAGRVSIPLFVFVFVFCALARSDAQVPRINPTEGYLPEYTRTVKPAVRETINTITDFPFPEYVSRAPVTFGVPFPRGAVRDAASIRVLDDDGSEVPAQIRKTATWHSEDGSLKWALLDFAAEAAKNYRVEYGSEVRRSRTESPLEVKETSEDIEVITGPLRVRYSKTESYIPKAVFLNDAPAAAPGGRSALLENSSRMYVEDAEGRRYYSSDNPEHYSVEVEESGAQRVTIKTAGRYRDDRGETICHYIARIHHYAGSAELRLTHTFIVAFDTDEKRLRDVAIPFALGRGKVKGAVYQTGLGPSAPRFDAPIPSYLVQRGASEFSVLDGGGETLRSGTRSGAWAAASGAEGGLVVGMRNFWREFPRELEIAEDGIVAHIWSPRAGKPLDFTARGQLGPRFEDWDKVYWSIFYRGGLDTFDQAYGLAKTSELSLVFHPPDAESAEAAILRATALEDPPFVHVATEHMANSDAFGPLQPRDPRRFPRAEEVYDAAWDHFRFVDANVWNHDGHIGNYGFFDYGDSNYQPVLNAAEKRWEARPWRRMASRFYGVSRLPWIHYARTGDRRHLIYAMDKSRHVMDIDMCHLSANRKTWRYPKHAGGRYGGNGGIIHYGADVYGIGPDSHVSPWMYYHYLTGDARALDILLAEGEYFLSNPSGGLENLRKNYQSRNSGGALQAMIDLWNATWDKRYLDAARDIAETIYSESERSGDETTRCDDVYMNRGMVIYYQATGDERMRDIFLHNMRERANIRIPDGDPRAFSGYGPAMAFYFTGDPSYLRRPLFLAEQYFGDVDTSDEELARGTPAGRWAMPHNTVQMLYGPFLLRALADLGEKVEPAGDIAAAESEIWLENTSGKPVEIELYWSVLSRPFYQGTVVREWPAYAHHNKLQAEIVVLDPSGKTVLSETIDYLKNLRLPYNSQDYPFSGRIKLAIPVGESGTYRIAPIATGGAPLRFALLDSGGLRWGVPVDRGGLSHGTAYYFAPPAENNRELKVEFKLLLLRPTAPVSLTVLDGDGRRIATRQIERNRLPSPGSEEWSIEIPENASRSSPWRIELHPSSNKQQILHLKIHGAPQFVSLSSNDFFIPEEFPGAIERRFREPPAGVVDAGTTLGYGEFVKLERGPALERTGLYDKVDSRRGGISFWIKPDWDSTDLRDAEILKWGGMRLYRRSQLGTYLSLEDLRTLTSGFILLPGHWYHLSINWDFDSPTPELSLSIDGVPMSPRITVEDSGKIKTLGDWTAAEGSLGGPAMTISEITISKKPRQK